MVIDQNSLSPRETLDLRVLCTLVATGERIQTCEECHHPERRQAGRLSPGERRRLIRRTRLANGCVGPGAANREHAHGPGYSLVDGTRFWRCPRLAERDPQVVAYLRAYLWYEHHGTLPVAGALLDQPAKLVSAFEVIRTEFRRIDADKWEKQRKRMERDSARGRALTPGKGRR
jgi:hypothetical protein